MKAVIEASHLSKKFNLRALGHREDSLRQTFVNGARRLLNMAQSEKSNEGSSEASNWIWALRDVSFRVAQGEVFGIIGANGAGKSTLLKILSRVTDPSEGYVRLKGRVASLLEVGTGFHPDLTGRENIFLNGVMLGMTKAEVQSKFDEIVAFAELEKFLDTPIKHYSSGMYVRLGFAVAAHLDPEILIVDEVLAVGDIAFQKKCLGKMSEFGESGRTILFVSHNIAAVINLCQKGIVLERGKITFDGEAKSAVEYYVRSTTPAGAREAAYVVDLRNATGRASQFQPLFQRLELCKVDGTPLGAEIDIGTPLRLRLEIDLPAPAADFDARVNFMNLYGQVIFAARSSYEPGRDWGPCSGRVRIVCDIPELLLTPGEYRIDVALLVDDKLADYVDDACRVKVANSDFYGTGKIPSTGFFVHPQRWRLE